MVRASTAEHVPPAEPGDPNDDPFCSFWKGTDLRVSTEICTVLDEAGIPHKMIRRQDHLFNLTHQAPYELGVPASLYEKAELAVKDAFGTDAEGAEESGYESQGPKPLPDAADHVAKAGILSPLLEIAKSQGRELMRDLKQFEQLEEPESEIREEPNEEAETVRRGNVRFETAFPADATVSVWQGDDSDTREMIAMSLQENDIFSRQAERGGAAEVYVMPEDEERAKAIVREILEAQSPESE